MVGVWGLGEVVVEAEGFEHLGLAVGLGGAVFFLCALLLEAVVQAGGGGIVLEVVVGDSLEGFADAGFDELV